MSKNPSRNFSIFGRQMEDNEHERVLRARRAYRQRILRARERLRCDESTNPSNGWRAPESA